MKWEDLKTYKPLDKTEIAIAKKEIENKISNDLSAFNFEKYGRKLIQRNGLLLNVIHLDSRGSWLGTSKALKVEIAIVSIFDTDILVNNYEPMSGTFLEDIVPGIRNYYQITKEYDLFADFISRNLIKFVIPYFNKFKHDNKYSSQRFCRKDHLDLFFALANHNASNAKTVLRQKIESLRIFENSTEEIKYWEQLEKCVKNCDWEQVDIILNSRKDAVIKKLKIKTASS